MFDDVKSVEETLRLNSADSGSSIRRGEQRKMEAKEIDTGTIVGTKKKPMVNKTEQRL